MSPVAQLLVLLAVPFVPAALAAALLLKGDAPWLQRAAALAALPALVTSLALPPGIAATLPWLLEGSEFGLDAPGRLFLLFSASIWLAAGVHALGSIAPVGRSRFLVHFLLVMSGNLGVIVARDMLAFYLFFALMSFAAYGLVVHDGSPAARRAGGIYMLLVVAGDMILYAALVPVAFEAGGTLLFEALSESIHASAYRDAIVGLLLVGFGIKAGLLGLHVVLPLVYGAAPPPAAAVLAGAMIHAGVLGWMRFLPFGAEATTGWGVALVALGVAAAFYGVLAGIGQRRPPVLLAYSSISQVGLMTAALGVALAAPEHSQAILAAVTIYALHHGFAKAALFFAVDEASAGSGAPAWRRAAVRVGLVLPAVALAGAPLTSGMLAKEYLKEIAYEASSLGAQLGAVLPWSALATTLLVARFLWLAWPAEPAGRRGADAAARRPAQTAAWLAVLALSAAAVWLLPIEHPPALWHPGELWSLVWPVAAGAALAAVAAAAAARGLVRAPRVPPGDVVVVAAPLADAAWRAWEALAAGPLPRAREVVREGAADFLRRGAWSRAVGAVEERLVGWRAAGALFVVLLVAFTLLALL